MSKKIIVLEKVKGEGKGYLRPTAAAKKIGVGRSTFYGLQNPNSCQYDPTFPEAFQVIAGARVWKEEELEAWVESRRMPKPSRLGARSVEWQEHETLAWIESRHKTHFGGAETQTGGEK